jgi:myosin-15
MNKDDYFIFEEIMRFMGDYPLGKSQKEIGCIYYLLKTVYQESELVDEVYCQLIKQTTNNKSTKKDSCFKGWKLISILTMYFKPTDVLKTYLFKYMESNAYDTKRPYNGKNTFVFAHF